VNQQLPTEIYATLAGNVDGPMVQRVFQACATAINGGVKTVHLLIQSTGGFVGDGIALYNYLRNLPLTLIAYNAGSVQSVAVILFLAAKQRKASETANFMIHRPYSTAQVGATAPQLELLTDGIRADDERMDNILRGIIKLPEEKWKLHQYGNLTISAKEALQFGLIDEIGDFKPPDGSQIANI
jgi:ATP-dependent Clp protease, protease subunit